MYSYAYVNVFLPALLIMIASLRTFSNDKLTFWRESASGINRVAYFLAKDVVDSFNVVIKPLIYLSMFYFFSNPRSTFTTNYTVTVVLVYCVTGIAYICAILLQPAPAQLVSVSHFFVAILLKIGAWSLCSFNAIKLRSELYKQASWEIQDIQVTIS